MAAKKDLSIEEIMALARGKKPAEEPSAKKEEPAATEGEAPASAPSAPVEKPAAPKAAAGDKPATSMSVEEMMAAARGKKAEGAAEKPAAAKPAPAGGKPATGMSVEEMMAAARAKKTDAAPAAEKPAAKPAAKAEAPAAKAEKPAAKKAEAAPALDTSSILAAARGTRQPGPMSKAEAAAKEKGPEAKGKTKLAVPPMPEKPAYAVSPAPAPAADGETRRGFFSSFSAAIAGSYLAVGFTTLTATNVLWALGGARFMFPNILTEPPTKFKVGSPDDYGPGQVETKYIAQYGVWVVRYEYEGKPILYALKTVCTHLGCTPNWLEAEQKFKCPCHGSGFYKDGINFEGPAPRPLERYAMRKADDGQLEIDKSRTFLEEKGEWKDPASFVAV